MEGETNQISAKETTRIEAFSDGVFAIAITLLILEIHVPVAKENETLIHSLFEEWTSFLALLIGFFTILICWINHHYMFSMIFRSNSMMAFVNGFKLLVVTITPFTTALLAKNIESPWLQSAVNTYAFNFALMGVAMTSIWVYARNRGFIRAGSDLKLIAITRYYWFASFFSILIWIVSYFTLVGCLILFVMMFLFFVYPEKMIAWMLSRNREPRIKSPTG